MFGNRKYEERFTEAVGNIGAYMTNAMMRLRQENIGWSLYGSSDTDRAIPLHVIKDHSARARHLAALNPLVKRGLVVRNAYMWTDPVYYRGVSNQDNRKIAENTDAVFSNSARMRDEISFATDGCVVYLIDKSQRSAVNVPLSRVYSVATDENTGEVNALLIASYLSNNDHDAVWYTLVGKPWVRVDDDQHATHETMRCVYQTVNRQSGEKLGKPDLMPALYYANAYKEYLEMAYYLTKALARIAYKTTSVNANQQEAVKSKMRTSGVGATASIGMGQDIQAVSKSGANIDFSQGTPLAAMVSAALDIPLSVLLTDGSAGGRQGAETALEDPTFKALELRRQVHAELVNKVAEGLGISMTMEYGAINNDQVHRRVQSLVLAYENHAIHQSELRSGVLQILQVAGAKDIEDLPDIAEDISNAEKDGRATGVGPLSDGTNDNRDNSTDA